MLIFTFSYHSQASVSKRQLVFIRTFVWEQSVKGTGLSTVTGSTESYTRPPSPLDRATASLREGRCSPTCGGGGGGVVAKGWCLPVDMLSPGDSPSRRPCSMGWGTGATGGPVSPGGAMGGWGGGRLGLCLGLGAGRNLVSVPVREGGDEREWGVPSGVCPGEDGGTWPGGHASP